MPPPSCNYSSAIAAHNIICDKLNVGGLQMALTATSILQLRHDDSGRPARHVLTGTHVAKVVVGRRAAATKYGRSTEGRSVFATLNLELEFLKSIQFVKIFRHNLQ